MSIIDLERAAARSLVKLRVIAMLNSALYTTLATEIAVKMYVYWHVR